MSSSISVADIFPNFTVIVEIFFCDFTPYIQRDIHGQIRKNGETPGIWLFFSADRPSTVLKNVDSKSQNITVYNTLHLMSSCSYPMRACNKPYNCTKHSLNLRLWEEPKRYTSQQYGRAEWEVCHESHLPVFQS
jgi:hypothetical protein